MAWCQLASSVRLPCRAAAVSAMLTACSQACGPNVVTRTSSRPGPLIRCNCRSWLALTLPFVPRLTTTTWRSRPAAARLLITASPVAICRSILASM